MLKHDYHAIGIMSGTSLDGVDLIYVRFLKDSLYTFEILSATTVAYDAVWKQKLTDAYMGDLDIESLNKEYGRYLGTLVNTFKIENSIDKVDFIASHGHTIFHRPEQGITLQIGDGQTLSNITKAKVLCDFRTQDVALGGQGAPLVPIGDQLLFSEYDYCLNLGGFANISYQQEDRRLAYDICPVNIVLNYFANKLGHTFDNKGSLSRQGKLHEKLLSQLNALNYYSIKPPKSLGLEWVDATIFPLIEKLNIDPKDILRTFTEHIAIQLNASISKLPASVLITGGGAFNDFLITRLRSYCKAEIVIPHSHLVEYKEALIFALLGLLKLNELPNVLKSVTGASRDHSSGKIFNPIV